MNPPQASSQSWPRQDILSLLQLIVMIIIPLLTCILPVIIRRGNWLPFLLPLSLLGSGLKKPSLNVEGLVFGMLTESQCVNVASLLARHHENPLSGVWG